MHPSYKNIVIIYIITDKLLTSSRKFSSTSSSVFNFIPYYTLKNVIRPSLSVTKYNIDFSLHVILVIGSGQINLYFTRPELSQPEPNSGQPEPDWNQIWVD